MTKHTKYLLIAAFSLLTASCSTGMKTCPKDCSKNKAPKLTESEMMNAISKAATPGSEHAILESLVGKFNVTATFWMDPSKKPSVEKGTAVHKWMLGKRFVKEKYTSNFAGKPFKGIGILGFDKVKGKYVSIWMDTMGTGMMTTEGSYIPSEKSIVMATSFMCPITQS